jgi:uncharacterized protein (DUF1810 family)
MNDPHRLKRFLEAQEGCYLRVLKELGSGRKTSHWMWYVFPQFRGLGSSGTAELYAIGSIEEARAYLADPVLGARLLECTRLVLAVEGRTAEQIFGFPDVLKFRSCATLFAEVAGPLSVFRDAIVKYYEGRPDERTLDLIEQGGAS